MRSSRVFLYRANIYSKQLSGGRHTRRQTFDSIMFLSRNVVGVPPPPLTKSLIPELLFGEEELASASSLSEKGGGLPTTKSKRGRPLVES